jgi:hypothetical protein
VGSSTGIAETEIQMVIELQMRGYTNTRIMQELWDTPKGGHQYQRDIERLRRIQTIIAQRAVSNG